jgi:hypothetical protein
VLSCQLLELACGSVCGKNFLWLIRLGATQTHSPSHLHSGAVIQNIPAFELPVYFFFFIRIKGELLPKICLVRPPVPERIKLVGLNIPVKTAGARLL